MNIVRLTLQTLGIPFKVSFTHASAERRVTQTVWVIAQSEDGLTGHGEGCPRDYVTGETNRSAAAFFDRHRDRIVTEVTDLPSLKEWSRAYEQEIDENPAAWCAIEVALLDLIARQNRQSVEALLGLPALTGPFVYSAVLGATGTKQFAETLDRYRKLGIRDYKIKLSGDLDRDRGNLAVLRAAEIAPAQVRADANNLWSAPDVAHGYLKSLDFPFAAIEEPLQPGQFAELSALADTLGTRIVLDESIARENQITHLPGTPERWIVNLRVSKMGGLLRSLEVVKRCRERGLSLIVGAQVGETSLLTRAALVVAQAARDILIAQEGAFGTMLLESDAVAPVLMFSTRGELDIHALQLEHAPGFGLAPIADLANRYLGAITDEAHRAE